MWGSGAEIEFEESSTQGSLQRSSTVGLAEKPDWPGAGTGGSRGVKGERSG